MCVWIWIWIHTLQRPLLSYWSLSQGNILIIIHSFYITLFSALEQTHCAHWHVILNEWLYHFIARIINIHGSFCGCCMAGATWNAAVSAQVLCTPFNHAPCYSVTSFKATQVTCHPHFWQNDRDLSRATAVTRGWNGYQNKSQHRKLTLEKKILPPLCRDSNRDLSITSSTL